MKAEEDMAQDVFYRLLLDLSWTLRGTNSLSTLAPILCQIGRVPRFWTCFQHAYPLLGSTWSFPEMAHFTISLYKAFLYRRSKHSTSLQ